MQLRVSVLSAPISGSKSRRRNEKAPKEDKENKQKDIIYDLVNEVDISINVIRTTISSITIDRNLLTQENSKLKRMLYLLNKISLDYDLSNYVKYIETEFLYFEREIDNKLDHLNQHELTLKKSDLECINIKLNNIDLKLKDILLRVFF